MAKITVRKIFASFIIYLLPAILLAGCGGGGGAAPSPSSNSGATSTLVERVSGTVGPETTTLAYEGVALSAALAVEQMVTINEKFYTSGRPAGVIGKIYDIQPDGLQFLPGARLCLSTSGTDYSSSRLVIVTGANLDQPLETIAGSGQVCAALSHSSPYSMKRASGLDMPEYTIFGSLDAKEKYTYKVTQRTENDPSWGPLFFVRIEVYCDLQCMEGGEREFKFIQGGAAGNSDSTIFDPDDGDLWIWDNGTYPLWRDFSGMPWTHLKSADGAIVGGIAYLLAAEYVNYFLGSSALMEGYIAQLDPDENKLQRFFYNEGSLVPYRIIEITRDETTMPGEIKIYIVSTGYPNRTYMVDRSTAAITKSWNNYAVQSATQSVRLELGDSGYETINSELLYYIYEAVGMEDTPDETLGNPWDKYPRYNPNQELFAVNVMNLLKGLGWQNLEAIEAYYRDRLEMWTNSNP